MTKPPRVRTIAREHLRAVNKEVTGPTIHLIAPFHTVSTLATSHCAFTQKSLRFSKMMKPYGYKIIEYSNEGSESEAHEHVVMLTVDEFKTYYKPEHNSPGAQASVGTPGFHIFNSRLTEALRSRVRVGDIVAHVFGPAAHAHLVQVVPGAIHVETGIGYPWTPFGAYPIFESEAWRHYQWGRYGNPGGVMPDKLDTRAARTWVIQNYFDVSDWPLSMTPQNTVVFMSRFVIDKGIEMLKRIIKTWDKTHPDNDLTFTLAGMGGYAEWLASADFTPSEMARISYLGVVTGKDRATLLGRGKAFLLPTIFVEPFGGAAIEANLCGTPVITPEIGAFTETVQDGVNGFRCRTVEDYVHAIECVKTLDRRTISIAACNRYSLETCAKKYDAVFRELTEHPSIE